MLIQLTNLIIALCDLLEILDRCNSRRLLAFAACLALLIAVIKY